MILHKKKFLCVGSTRKWCFLPNYALIFSPIVMRSLLIFSKKMLCVCGWILRNTSQQYTKRCYHPLYDTVFTLTEAKVKFSWEKNFFLNVRDSIFYAPLKIVSTYENKSETHFAQWLKQRCPNFVKWVLKLVLLTEVDFSKWVCVCLKRLPCTLLLVLALSSNFQKSIFSNWKKIYIDVLPFVLAK